MKYMLLIFTNEQTVRAMSMTDNGAMLAAYGAYTQALTQSGVLVHSARLRPTATATTLRAPEGKQTVLDGPYADTKEQLGGYYMIDVPDLDQALSWAARCPASAHGAIEVRPVWEM